MTMEWSLFKILASIKLVIFAGEITDIDAISWNKIYVQQVTRSHDSQLELARNSRGLIFGPEEVDGILDEAIGQFGFMRALGANSNKTNENRTAYAVRYTEGTVDTHLPFPVFKDEPVSQNLAKCRAHGYEFYIRKNEQDGSNYTLFFPASAPNSTNEYINFEDFQRHA